MSKNVPKSKKILIVEDEPSLREALQIKLTEEGFNVSVASDGKEALEALKNSHFDLMLLDLIMPVMDGFMVLEAMQSNNQAIPTVVLTNSGQGEEKKHALSLGALDYMVKTNATLAGLVEQVKKYLS